jgi:hypothetical protein
MLIPFTNTDGKNIAQAEVEIPDQVLNHFAISVNEEGSVLNLPHIRPGTFTRVMGDAALRFNEPQDKLTMPDKGYKGIHVNFPAEDLLKALGFQRRGPAAYWHPGLGTDDASHWILFDPKTDDIPFIIRKVFNLGVNVGMGWVAR